MAPLLQVWVWAREPPLSVKVPLLSRVPELCWKDAALEGPDRTTRPPSSKRVPNDTAGPAGCPSVSVPAS